MPHKLSDILGAKFSRKDELSRQLEIVKVFDLYRQEITKIFPAGEGIKLISLKNQTLTVEAPSSVIASELRIREDQIVTELNKAFGKKMVKRVIYRF